MIFSPQALTVSSLLPHFLFPSCCHHLLHPILPAVWPELCKRSVQKQQSSGESTWCGHQGGDEGEGADPCSEPGHWAFLTCCLPGCVTERSRGHGGGRNRVSLETWEEKAWIQSKSEAWTARKSLNEHFPSRTSRSPKFSLTVSRLRTTEKRQASVVRKTNGQEYPKPF